MSGTTAVRYYYNAIRCNWADILVKSKRYGNR